ncbi:MAG: hypothetical protein EXS31_13820 [Pedosphaera sp.]|nr:hypothetical protein [Pedosphaera sp.]
MARFENNLWLHRFAVVTALATLGLIGIGGLVTSHGVGMAVPDWPTTYGYNMFFFPISEWVGGVFYEHTHRLWASTVGLLVVALTRWLGGNTSRRPLAVVGIAEIAAGMCVLALWPHFKGMGFFLTGIGGVVLLAAMVPVKNQPANRALVNLGWLAFVLVQLQGLLGGLRVVLFKDQIGIVHGMIAQLFLLLLCLIAFATSQTWKRLEEWKDVRVSKAVRSGLSISLVLIFLQLVLGATMRHQHAGLAVPDFPLAYGKVWPPLDDVSLERINQQRVDSRDFKPITAFQIVLHLAHRIGASATVVAVALAVWRVRREMNPIPWLARMASLWLCVILCQAALGAATVWSNKAADITTVHVIAGAISLVLAGVLLAVTLRLHVLHESGVPLVQRSALGKLSMPSQPASAV